MIVTLFLVPIYDGDIRKIATLLIFVSIYIQLLKAFCRFLIDFWDELLEMEAEELDEDDFLDDEDDING